MPLYLVFHFENVSVLFSSLLLLHNHPSVSSALRPLAGVCEPGVALRSAGGPTCACGVNFLHGHLAPSARSRPTVQYPEAGPQDLVPHVHLQKLEGASTSVTLRLGSLHKRVLQVPRQPQVLGATPRLAVTPSRVEASTLKGSPRQLPGADERARERAGGTWRHAHPQVRGTVGALEQPAHS